MEIAEFKVRCYVCRKKFLIPALSDFNYGDFLFVNYKTREFKYFSQIENQEVENIIKAKLNSDKTLVQQNDKTKGNTVLKLIGKLSDGEFEPILSYIKCPRCNIGFHSYPNRKTGMTKITELTFEKSKRKTLSKNIKEIEL